MEIITVADACYTGFQPPAVFKLEGGNLEETWKVRLQKFFFLLHNPISF